MSFADNYGEQQAYRKGFEGELDPEPKDFCDEYGHEKCDGELGACICKCHEMQEAREELTRKTFEFFAHEVETQRRSKHD